MGYEAAYRMVSQPSLRNENTNLKTRVVELEKLLKRRGTVEGGEGPSSTPTKRRRAGKPVVDWDSAIAAAEVTLNNEGDD